MIDDSGLHEGWAAMGQQGGGGSPAPAQGAQASTELGVGALLTMLGIWALAEYASKKLR